MELIRQVRIISMPVAPTATQCEEIVTSLERFLDKQETELQAVLSELQRDFHTRITLAVL